MTEEEIVNLLYLMLGLTESDIPREVVALYVAQFVSIYPDNECLVLYNSSVAIYNWLIRKSGADAVSGKRREKKGQREIEVQDSDKSSSWKNALDTFLKSPWEVFPQCRAELSATACSNIIIGGVSKSEVNRVKTYSDSLNQNDERSPYSPSTPDDDKLY